MVCRVAFHDSTLGSITSERSAEVRAWLKSLPGFIDGWHAEDPKTGRILSFTVWESEAHMMAVREKTPPGGPLRFKPAQLETFTVVKEF